MRIFAVLTIVILAPVTMAVQNQPASTQNGRNAQQSNPPTTVAVHCDCTTKKDDGEKKSQGWHKFVTWPEGIAVWVVILTLCAIVWQAIETRRSVGATANSQRSWLLVESVDRPDFQQIWINKATIRFKIIGNSPLRIMEGKLIYSIVASRPDGKPPTMHRRPDLPEKPTYGDPVDLASSPSMGRIHAPGDPVAVDIALESMFLTPENFKALQDGNSFLCVYGFLRYKDSFVSWRRRETRFCYACGNWGPTIPKADDGYFVAGPIAYNDVMEYPAAWKRIFYKAVRSYRKTQHKPEKAN